MTAKFADMDGIIVPIAPAWHLPNSCYATSDGGLLYIGYNTISFIPNPKSDAVEKYKVINIRQPVLGLAVDPDWSVSTEKYVAVLALDNSIQIWSFESGCAVSGHKAHFTTITASKANGSAAVSRVFLDYMSNRNVLSLSTTEIVVYCVPSNSYYSMATFLPSRSSHVVNILKCSPYNENIFAIGCQNGLVLICDLQRMSIVYTLRGHDCKIKSLSWIIVDDKETTNPTKKDTNTQSRRRHVSGSKERRDEAAEDMIASEDNIFDIYNVQQSCPEFGVPCESAIDSLKCSENIFAEKATKGTEKLDFIDACNHLKEEIDFLKQEMPPTNEVTLTDCQLVEKLSPSSSCCGKESSEGSLDLLNSSSDGDNACADQAPSKTKFENSTLGTKLIESNRIVLKADVHINDSIKRIHIEPNEARLEKSESKQRVNILLASASTDFNLWIWDTVNGAAHSQFQSACGDTNSKFLACVEWLDGNTLFAINRTKRVGIWKLLSKEKQTDGNKFKEETRQFSQRNAMAFAVCGQHRLIWIISGLREISCEDMDTGKILAKYSCGSTNIRAIRECPDDMNKVALGFSDRGIGIMDLSTFHSSNVSIKNLTKKVDNTVLSLAWSEDGKHLAFGTKEGRIGVFNMERETSPPFLYNPFCGKPIYSMDWKDNHIFVCCNGKLAMYQDSMTKADGYVIPSISGCSCVTAREGCLFVGTENGHLMLYRRKQQTSRMVDYELMQDISICSRYISDIAWSPIKADTFAVVSIQNAFNIYQFNVEECQISTLHTIVLNDKKTACYCVKWSNMNGTELLTCNWNGTVCVWDLSSSEWSQPKFIKEFSCGMTAGIFLPTDENVIICSGKSISLAAFNRSVEPTSKQGLSQRKTTNPLDDLKWALKVLSPCDTKKTNNARRRDNKLLGRSHDMEISAHEIMEEIKAAGMVDVAHSNNDNKDILDTMKDLKITEQSVVPITSAFMKKPASLLCLTSKELNKHALSDFLSLLSDKDSEDSSSHHVLTSKLFANKMEANELLEEEMHNHQRSQMMGVESLLMPMLGSKTKDEILKCIQKKKLNEWHVSLASSISHQFWLQCCRAFAEQLLEDGYILQAATYMIAMHNHAGAIDMLIEKQYFKEALLMARIYLQEDDPLFAIIVEKWITRMDFTGNLEAAALISFLSGQLNRAHEILSKVRNATPALKQVLRLLKLQQCHD